MSKIRTITIINKKVELNNHFNHSLEEVQRIVGGYIEMPKISRMLHENDIDIIINEEGKFIDLPITALIVDEQMQMVDYIKGNIIFTSHDSAGNTTGLNDNQIDIIKGMLNTRGVIETDKGMDEVYVIPL